MFKLSCTVKLAEIIHAGGETQCYNIHKRIYSAWNKEELP
jgi:hypothetical protein